MGDGLIGACTIISPNYLAFARTVSASYLEQHPGHRFFVLIVADLAENDRATFSLDGFTPVLLDEIGLEDVRREAMKYDILELNTNVKPAFLKHLMRAYDLETVLYLDPDLFVYSPLTPVFDALQEASMVLTPHMTRPIHDGKLPGEQEMLYNGTYNLGFIGIRRCDESWEMLDWWETRCLELGFSEGRTGLFVDQKWMNLAPGLFERVSILRHAGCNMAYWNLHERVLSVAPDGRYQVNGIVPLCFFHFSGIVLQDAAVLSKNTDRFTLADRPDLQPMFASYKAAVLTNQGTAAESHAYGFDAFTDGTTLTRLARRIYSKHPGRWAGQDPFDADGTFATFAKELRLVDGKAPVPKNTWKEFNAKDRRVQMVHRLLKAALRILGPNRYELLMRYLSYITVLRHQSVFLDDRPTSQRGDEG